MKQTLKESSKRNLNKKAAFTFFAILSLQLIFSTSYLSAQESTSQFVKGSDTLVVYTDVPGLAPSEFYTIRVRSAATKNQWVECYPNITRSLHSSTAVDAKMDNNKKEHYYNYVKDWSHTYANIEMNSRLEVEVSRKNGVAIKKAAVHPAVRAEAARVADGKAYFFLNKPAQITIDIDGQMDDTDTGNGYAGPPIHAVTLFANPVIDKPLLTDANVMVVEPGVKPSSDLGSKTILYFKPGVHNLGRDFKFATNASYYIPGDAIVYGTFNNIDVGPVDNVRMYGYGSISGDKIKHPDHDPEYNSKHTDKSWKTIYVENCKNFRVEGLAVVNVPFHAININSVKSSQKESFCHWVKVITWRGNGDGIGSAHEVYDCFIRTQDDCTYVKGDRKRCVFWTDVNGTAFVLAGMPSDREILIEDCDVIYARHCSLNWNGGRIFSRRAEQAPKDPGTIKVNVTFKDIRITDKFQTLETFQLVSANEKGTKSGAYSGITFKNISSVKTPEAGKNQVFGWENGRWSNITFDNVVLGGKKIQGINDLGKTNEFVSELKFINSSSLQKSK